jgi:anti-sigma B factor antagonist
MTTPTQPVTETTGSSSPTHIETTPSVEWPDRRTAVVIPAGEIDLRRAADVRRELFGAVADGAEIVVVDLSTTTFIDSMTLGILLGAGRRLQRRGGELRIACVDPNIKRIFEITLLDRVFAIYPSLAAALGRSAATP